jgi:hypothetical protein
MKDRGRARQIANRVGPGKLGSDSGFAIFVEILAREAARSLTASEGDQPGTFVANGAPATCKKRASYTAPPAIAQDAGKAVGVQLPQSTGNKANAPDARQGRLFD